MEESLVDFVKEINTAFSLEVPDIRTYSALNLAYIGDSIFDLIVRTLVIERGAMPVHRLHKIVSQYVRASAQANLFWKIEPDLTQEEKQVYQRGRNANPHTIAKHATRAEYTVATGLEALMGYLYLTGQMERLFSLLRKGFSDWIGKEGKETCKKNES